MDCVVSNTPADKIYTRRAIVWSLVYVALVFALSSARKLHWLEEPWNWLTAWTPAIPIAGIMWALLVFLRDSDEFVRAVTAKRLVIALAITQVLCTIWGFLEVYAGASHQEMYLVFPIFWLSLVAVPPFVRSST
jgi:putative oxidoreductase